MKTSTILTHVTFLVAAASVAHAQDSNATATIIAAATADSIDLTILNIFDTAIAEIEDVYDTAPITTRNVGRIGRRATPDNIVDVHAHFVPAWYKAIYPNVGGSEVPDWTMAAQLAFMAGQGISRALFSFSTPGPNVYPGNKILTVALARLMNEQAAAYCRAYPGTFNFYAQVPFPYTTEAIREAEYAITKLGAIGIWVQSNTEGIYLGDATLKSFFQAFNNFSQRPILYVHPAVPVLRINNVLVDANPTTYIDGKIEFYFETARTIMDLTLTQTIHNFTNINYVIPHVGGAYPSTVDRILKSYPTIYDSSFAIYDTRFWWDSAGPTYAHQVSGLLGMGVPKSQLLYGTDFPYAPLAPQAGSLAAVKASPLFTADEKTAIFSGNVRTLFGSIISW
ncbi:hypothetical protein HYPSUDRAFT_35893 [Hypholoma sublateritium FD-334 SS-4]|uniref:Amidohydrolase-related domain-containing protein n=1 Tax=Hypholoma sublateritium (strain FD-334 SS-4) TaxID=945553 RepID=A0A0D2P723_HYPSF|nr:hypothetical protein HYPSUDRAFT_35893 [Hypholoma sublateritium FD-334 SS-4]